MELAHDEYEDVVGGEAQAVGPRGLWDGRVVVHGVFERILGVHPGDHQGRRVREHADEHVQDSVLPVLPQHVVLGPLRVAGSFIRSYMHEEMKKWMID